MDHASYTFRTGRGGETTYSRFTVDEADAFASSFERDGGCLVRISKGWTLAQLAGKKAPPKV